MNYLVRVKLVIILFLIATPCFAQRNRVLICDPDTNTNRTRENVVQVMKDHYKGEVVLCLGVLPDTLSSFDAVFMLWLDGKDAKNASELVKLKSFLVGGGNLYFEGFWFFFQHDTVFSHLTGVDQEGGLDLAEDILSVHGDTPFFTAGIDYPIDRMTFKDHGHIKVFVGDVQQVLWGCDAYQHENEHSKVVFHWHIYKSAPYDAYYPEFISKVACNYFELCQPLSVHQEAPASSETITYENMTRTIHYSGASNSKTTLSVYSLLGTKIWESKINGSLQLPASIAAGSYIVNINEDGNSVADQKISVY